MKRLPARPLDRRSMLKISVGGTAALMIAPKGAFAQGASIKASWYGGQDTHDRMQEALALYSERTGTNIEVEFAPFGDFYDRLPVQYAGGGAADVHRHSMTFLYEYTNRGLLADLGPYVGDTINTDDLYPGVVEIGTRNGVTNAIGNNQIAIATFYDMAKLEEVGMTDRLDGMTWDDYLEIAVALGDAGGEGKYGTNDAGDFLGFFEMWLKQRGTELYPEAGGVGFSGEEAAEWFAYWERMRSEGGAPPPAITAESGGFQNAPFVRDIAGMQIGWCQQLVFYQALMEPELGITTGPIAEGLDNNGHYIRALDFWVVPAQSDNPEEAAKLINFLLNDEEAIAILGLTLGGPASEKASAILQDTAEGASAKVLTYLEGLRENADPDTPIWKGGQGELESVLDRLNQSVGFGQITAEEAGEQLASEGQRIID
ncbi:ABC transporter substrate-binding protein [Pelagovum pacificum]|uniref:Extracellular solute-binding protein n=1 Tax=Pelagovum pacificum TaxID=2588711 RepID=A0A5C5GF00_9RHOB|nr:extracellular solute-binding protein [Pelagovum pacificum]QQA43559.1 extracellular solute-binding protein [Pelagovum pacificum]TNY33303.1 extracellular solute-binding protein [Pelagovum pacificum]